MIEGEIPRYSFWYIASISRFFSFSQITMIGAVARDGVVIHSLDMVMPVSLPSSSWRRHTPESPDSLRGLRFWSGTLRRSSAGFAELSRAYCVFFPMFEIVDRYQSVLSFQRS